MPDLVLLERTERWAVVAKPPRMLVHRNAQFRDADVVLQRLRNQLKRHVYAVHRLDRPASGCLLFALDREQVAPLQAAMTSPEASKTYVAFVRGELREPGPIVVETPVADENGVSREARSVVRRLGASAEPRCSLLLVQPETGRYHQVRRHVRDLDHPILGDTKHGDGRANRLWREQWGLARLGLHCVALDLPLPEGRLQVSCPLFEDMAAVLRQMPWWDEAVAALPALGLPALPVPDLEQA